MATTLKLENKGKPTPPFWKKVGEALVWSMPLVTAAVWVIPIPDEWKAVISVGANTLLALGKKLTTYTFNPEKVPLTYFPQVATPEQPDTKDVTRAVERIAEIEKKQ
jgi:hypothetical protein